MKVLSGYYRTIEPLPSVTIVDENMYRRHLCRLKYHECGYRYVAWGYKPQEGE